MLLSTTAQKKIAKLRRRVRIVQGGTSSSKTFSILPLLINYATTHPNSEISIVSESVPHLKRGVIRDFKKIMQWTGNWKEEQYNRSSMTYNFVNGSFIEYFSVDNPSKLRGARRHILFVNECNNIDFESYQQLAIRTSKFIYLDFNPTGEFWVNTELENAKDSQKVILTYLDNEAAPKAAVDEILKAKAKAETGNKFWLNWFRVYGLGLQGRLFGSVYENWETGAFQTIGKTVLGQDFGFSNDPSTLLKTNIDKKNKIIYVEECFYLTKLTATQLGDLNAKHAGKDLIVADSADPRLIDSLKQYCNIVPAIKGQGSIVYGIAMIQDYKLVIDPESKNLINELKNYVWLEKKSQTPISKFDHLLDALRYSVSYQLANPNSGEYHIW
jgi:phage terminase large subunit